VATIPGSGSAFDQAATAARAALAMQGYDADAPIAVATGSAEVEGRWPVGEAIDRAVALIGEPGRVRVDELTAGLVGPRFRIARDAHGLSLVGPADDSDEPPLLLGRPSPFVGREWELGWLAETFEECVREETAHVALVTGEPGIGKSRLLVELLARLAARAVVLRGRADPVRAGAPFSVLGDAVRRAAGIRDADPPDVRRRSLRARVERSGAGEAARVTTFLGELSASPFPDDESPFLRAARADPIVMSDQIRRAFEDWLGAEAERPVILALEDLQWADLPSVRVVASALRTLRSRPLLVLGFARPGVHDVFPGLWAEAGLAELRLEGLSRANAEAIAHAALREGTDAARVAEIALRADGNPLTLEELVRVEAQGPRAAGAQTVRAMMRARLEAEDARARRGLRAASVFGSTFPGAGVAALLAESEDRVESLLADLASRELLVRRADGWGFRHDLVREAAAEMLTDEDARLGHRLAAEWLLAAGETDALRLAEHFERGGEGRRAVPQLLAAARQALEANDLEAAVRRADRGLACGAEGAERGGLLLAQAEAHKWQGRQVEMLRCASEAASLLAPGSAPWCAAIAEVANASMRLGDPDRIVEVTRALFEIERPDPLEAWVVAAARTGQALLYAGRHDALAGLALRLEAVVTSVADLGPFARARLSFLRGARALVAGDLETFLSRMADAIAHSEAAGDRRGASMARAERGYGLLQGGCDEEAARELGLALEGARRIGLAHVVAHAENNLGLVALRRGDLSEAHALEERAMEAYRAQGNRRAEGGCRTYMAEIDLLAGDHQRAEREARVAVDLLGTAPLGALALATLARVLAAAERGAEALVPAREAMRRLETLGRLEEGEAVVRLALAEALAAAGDKEAAAETLASGRAWLLARAEGIEDPELRARFLERVPEHARILEWDPTTSGSRTA
jgi:tetratricopeptide (TPR) repeat protein